MKKEKGRHEIEKLRRRASESSTLSRRAKDSIAKLVSLTNDGSSDAATELHSTVAFAAEMLTWLCKRKSELFTRIAQEKLSWPVMYSPHPEKVRENATFVREMKLGRNTEINLAEGKVFSWQVPANVVGLIFIA